MPDRTAAEKEQEMTLGQETAALRRIARKASRGRSPQIARLRVRLKRSLRLTGVYPAWDAPTHELIRLMGGPAPATQ